MEEAIKLVGVICRVTDCIRNCDGGRCRLEVIELNSDGCCEMMEIEGEEG